MPAPWSSPRVQAKIVSDGSHRYAQEDEARRSRSLPRSSAPPRARPPDRRCRAPATPIGGRRRTAPILSPCSSSRRPPGSASSSPCATAACSPPRSPSSGAPQRSWLRTSPGAPNPDSPCRRAATRISRISAPSAPRTAIEADRIVWSCGGWLAGLFADHVQLKVTRQELFFFDGGPAWADAPGWVDYDHAPRHRRRRRPPRQDRERRRGPAA